MNKRGKILIVFLFFSIFLISYISAFSFSDFWNKITGKAVSPQCDNTCQNAGFNGYVDYKFQNSKFSKLETIFNWSIAPTVGNTAIYPALMHFWFESGQGGYTGPQYEIVGGKKIKKVIFSIWSMNNKQFTSQPYSDWCKYGDNEGNFVQCIISNENIQGRPYYNWDFNKEYKISLRKDETLGDGVVWASYIIDLTDSKETLIGKIKLNNSNGLQGYGLLTSTGGFLEYYSPNVSSNKCLSAEDIKIIRKGPYADDKWLPKKGTAKVSYCNRIDRTSPETGIIIEEGGKNILRTVNVPIGSEWEDKILWNLDSDPLIQKSNNTTVAPCVPFCANVDTITCGQITDDRCGGKCTIGTKCAERQTCNNKICVSNCIPKSCSYLNKNCGNWDDGCGNSLNCGQCLANQSSNITVTACVPFCASASAVTCGQVTGDGCGKKCDMGTKCNIDEKCDVIQPKCLGCTATGMCTKLCTKKNSGSNCFGNSECCSNKCVTTKKFLWWATERKCN